jgi:catechol 2,3-dioxygenase-like lactoylglutathione lyase family enzyme
MIMGVKHISLSVNGLERSFAFFTRVLGFRHLPQSPRRTESPASCAAAAPMTI